MNRKLRRLIENIYFDVKRKLNENIFLDPDICPVDDDDVYDDLYTDAADELTGNVVLPLVECEDRSDVINYLTKTTGINSIISDIFTYTFQHISDYNYNIPFSRSYYDVSDPLKRNYFTELAEDIAKALNPKYPNLSIPGGYSDLSLKLDLCGITHNISIRIIPVGNVPNWNNSDVNVYGLQFKFNDVRTPVIICNYEKVPRRSKPIQDSAIYSDIQTYNNYLHL